MLDLNQVRAFGVEFDPIFGLSGGSDTLFTRQLVAAGGELIWCDSAPVVEWIPAKQAHSQVGCLQSLSNRQWWQPNVTCTGVISEKSTGCSSQGASRRDRKSRCRRLALPQGQDVRERVS